MRLFALVLLLCTGCDLLFDIHAIELGDARGSGDASMHADAFAGPPACSPITMLADDFTNDDIVTVWPRTTAESSDQVTVTSGQVVINANAVDSYATLDPGRYYDLREHYFSVRITDDQEMTSGDFVSLDIDSEVTGFRDTFSRDDTTMTFIETLPSGTPVTVTSFLYDLTNDAYLRVGVIGGAFVFETSPNGITYTRKASVTDGSGFTFVRPSIQAYRGTSAQPFTVFVDDVDDGTPSGAACPIVDLHDDFSAAQLSEQWARSEMTNGTLTLVGGIANAATSGGGSKVTLGPSTIYDLEGGAISIEIPQMIANSTDNRVTLSVVTGTGDQMAMTENNGFLTANAQLMTGTAPNINKVYDPAKMLWWRIANQAEGMTWEVSGDGAIWTMLNAPFPMAGIDRCDIAIVVESNSGAVGDTQFDNVDSP